MRLYEFLRGAAGRPYRELVQHQIRRQGTRILREAAFAEMHLLPPALRPLAESYFDVVNEALLCDAGFWRTATCQSAVDAVIRLANQHFGLALNIPVEPAAMSGINQELAFCLFQMATLSFAYNASDQKGLRKFMGIRKGLFR